jgi:hypothetical protein
LEVIATQSLHDMEWPQWSEYRILGGWIFASGKERQKRHLAGVDLVTPFARLALVPLEDRVAVLHEQFVRPFGLLGYTVLSGRPHRTGKFLRMADDLAWTLAHVRNVDRILRLHKSRFGELDQLIGALDKRSMRTRKEGQLTWSRHPQPITLQVPLVHEPWQAGIASIFLDGGDNEPMAVQRRLVAALLNPNLAGISRQYGALRGVPEFRCRALIEALYWQLADKLGEFTIRTCKCGALFFPTDERQKFCPPPDGRNESLCAKKFYMRRFRKAARRSRVGRPSQ